MTDERSQLRDLASRFTGAGQADAEPQMAP